jgi:phosphoribosyl 1,2-cyclic phosphodiesterase
MIDICALASGSNGNCYYVGNKEDAVLIDAGVSCRQVLDRMKQKNLNPSKVKAIFISHEHADHFRGVRVLSKKLDVPVYMTGATLKNSWGPNRPQKVVLFTPGDVVAVGGFKVHSFLKQHDAAEPCSFRVEHLGVNVGVMTDIGAACENVTTHLSACQALFLESNYDERMLLDGPYPQFLKLRVSSQVGHLSNKQAFELLEQFHHPEIKVVFLSHLSAENNRPDIAAAEFVPLAEKVDVRLTNRYAPSDVFTLLGEKVLQ